MAAIHFFLKLLSVGNEKTAFQAVPSGRYIQLSGGDIGGKGVLEPPTFKSGRTLPPTFQEEADIAKHIYLAVEV